MLSLDEIENRLSLSFQTGKSAGCMFCDVEPGLVLAETENLVLIRDKFPIVDGHLMIISKTHFGCMGELPLPYFDEIEALRERAAGIFRGRSFIGYEHGRAGHCVKLKGSQITCHHFHLHYLPLQADIRSRLAHRFTAYKVASLSQVRGFYERLGEYLYVETMDRAGFFYPASSQVEPHLLRTLVCEASGVPHRSDWENL